MDLVLDVTFGETYFMTAGGVDWGACFGSLSMQPASKSIAAQCRSPAIPLSNRPVLLCLGLLWVQLAGDC